MKTVGIIAEYNPLHNGHQYQMQKAKQLSSADFVIIAMSGDFVQRGEPAIYDKYTRTHMALNAGADLVLEIPACFAAASAEDFASCAVSLLSRIGVVDTLCFGSECGNAEPLLSAANLLAQESENYQVSLKNKLANGLSFPKARAEVLTKLLSEESKCSFDWNTLLSSPNNILGIEYCKALLRQNSRIQPMTIQRSGLGYHDTQISEQETCFASASAIRKAYFEGNQSAVQKQMPHISMEMEYPIFPDDVSMLFNYRLLSLSQSGTDLTDFSDVSRELCERIKNQLLDFQSFTERIQSLKTRQYTYTRISRALLHILLGITCQDMQQFRSNGYAGYVRILGFKKQALPLMSEMKRKSQIPLISKVANAEKLLKEHSAAWQQFQYDLHAAHIYQMLQQQKYGIQKKNEFTQPVIILD